MFFAPKRRVPPSFTEPSRYTHARRIWKTSIGHVNNTIKQTHNHLSYTKRSLRGVIHPSTAPGRTRQAAPNHAGTQTGAHSGPNRPKPCTNSKASCSGRSERAQNERVSPKYAQMRPRERPTHTPECRNAKLASSKYQV